METANGNGHAPAADPAHEAVVELLAKYLAQAKGGRFRYVGIVLIDGEAPGELGFEIEHGGAVSLQFAAGFAVDGLKMRITENIFGTVMEKRSPLAIPRRDIIRGLG